MMTCVSVDVQVFQQLTPIWRAMAMDVFTSTKINKTAVHIFMEEAYVCTYIRFAVIDVADSH